MNKACSSLPRRDFIKLAAAGSGGLILALYLGGCGPQQPEPTVIPITPAAENLPPFAPNLYIRIGRDNILTVMAFRTEMGQGIRTAIAMIIADELDMDWSQVRIEQVGADSHYGDQITGGSVSVSRYYKDLRQAAAVARSMLVTAAAQQWDTDSQGCTTAGGKVVHPNGSDQLAYGDLVEAASALKPPLVSSLKLKDEKDFHLIGTDLGNWDAPAMLTGKAQYAIDVRLPGMLYAVLARCPVNGGTLASLDDSQALQVPGVKQVLNVDGKIAVVASDTWAAIKGRRALVISWEEGRNAALMNEDMFQTLRDQLPAIGSASPGELEALYEIPYEPHETMEPVNCTADVRADRAEIWIGSQEPQLAQSNVASRTHLSTEVVTVHNLFTGGAFGRKHQSDAAVEAALISQAVGAPVQVIWTREDDIQHDFYHPMSVQYARASLSGSARPRLDRVSNEHDIPTGYWRSVENFPEAFGRECCLDEMAAATGRDPLDLRRALYNGPALEVIELAAEKAGWGSELPQGWGRGIAYHATFGVTHVAQVVEVSVDDQGSLRVERVVCAVNCGRAINPDNIKAQMEGGIAFGLTAALQGGVTIENGRVRQSNFNDAPILEIGQMPKVEVYIVQSDMPPRGIGEMGVPPIAPAVCNAVFAATGKRIRRLPILKDGRIPA